MANIKDVAKEAGVSVTTVSRVMNNRGYISEKTRKKVYDAIDKINKIGVNINQLTRLANSTGSIYEDKLNHEFLELEKLRNSIYEKYI